MDDTQITIVCFIKAKQETVDIVKDRLLNLVKMTRRETGNVNYDLHVSDTDSSLFIIYENWKDQAAFDNHISQPYLKDFLAEQDELLECPLDVKICKIVK